MAHLETLLICDGSSDAALEHPVRWLLSQAGYSGTLSIQIADFSRFPKAVRRLEEKIHIGKMTYKPDLIFIHRDAEKQSYEERLNEIGRALKAAGIEQVSAIPIIPVRMLEAWLLIDEGAIRRAAGNPNGCEPISLPKPARVEFVSDPKEMLCDLLLKASGLSGRRLRKFRPLSKRHLVAEEISDFSLLDASNSFSELRSLLSGFLKANSLV